MSSEDKLRGCVTIQLPPWSAVAKLSSKSHPPQKKSSPANDYARRRKKCVQRAHFQLETEMRRISVACECIADVLRKSTLPDGPALDDRLQDWLCTDEPEQCLHMLVRMESLLQNHTSSWLSSIFPRGRGGTPAEDKIKDAAEYFGSHKPCFHFLFSSEIWQVYSISR